jgi:hypothetical protein
MLFFFAMAIDRSSGCLPTCQLLVPADSTTKDFLGSSSCFLSIESPDFYKKVQCKNFYLNLDKLSQYNFVPQINLQQGIRQLCIN